MASDKQTGGPKSDRSASSRVTVRPAPKDVLLYVLWDWDNTLSRFLDFGGPTKLKAYTDWKDASDPRYMEHATSAQLFKDIHGMPSTVRNLLLSSGKGLANETIRKEIGPWAMMAAVHPDMYFQKKAPHNIWPVDPQLIGKLITAETIMRSTGKDIALVDDMLNHPVHFAFADAWLDAVSEETGASFYLVPVHQFQAVTKEVVPELVTYADLLAAGTALDRADREPLPRTGEQHEASVIQLVRDLRASPVLEHRAPLPVLEPTITEMGL